MSTGQIDLFGLQEDVDVQTIFPEFVIEGPMSYIFGKGTEVKMRKTLTDLGFIVGAMKYHEGRVLVFPVGESTDSATLFEVTYPKGWKLTEDMRSAVYWGDHNPVRQLVDHNNYMRGIVHCGRDLVPLSGTIYTRYSILSGVPLNFTKLPIDLTEVRSIVIDRTKMNRLNPFKIDEIEYVDRRWLLGEKYPAIIDMSPNERMAWCSKNIPKEDRFGDLHVSGSSLWLDEHFPDWKNPVAYWPA